MLKWIIFNCYGTLVHPIQNTGAKILLEQFRNQEQKNKIKNTLLTQDQPIENILETHAITDENIREQIIQWFRTDTTILYDDAKKILDKCYNKDIPFVILSNISTDYIPDIERLIGVPYDQKRDELFTILYSCQIGYKKPELQSYQQAIEFFKNKWISKEEIIMSWDNKKYDYEEPLKLWIPSIRLDRKNNNTDPNVKTIQNFDQLDLL
jgi:FMN phosphatase YigB (HAD superfamily)